MTLRPGEEAPGRVLWTPPADVRETTEIGRYLTWLERERGLAFATYEDLQHWSVADLPAFWTSIWDFFEVKAHAPYTTALASDAMPGATWFPGARLNFAEHLIGTDDRADEVAVVAYSQTRDRVEVTYARATRPGGARPCRAGAARRRPGRPRRRLHAEHPRDAGGVRGDGEPRARCGRAARPSSARAASSTASCSSSPTVLLAVGGYGYRDRSIDRREEVAAIRAALPTLRHVVHVPYGEHVVPDALSWDELLAEPAPLGVPAGRVRPSAVRAVLVRDDRTAEGDRPRARRHPARVPQGARVQLGPQAGRPAALVQHDVVDDVERARRGARSSARRS